MEGGLNLVDMWGTMTIVAKAIAVVLFFMSMWSIGVAVERIYTFMQAKNQSKVYAPQVAKHLKDGRLKDAIAISTNKNYRYSHLAKVVLAGLQARRHDLLVVLCGERATQPIVNAGTLY